MKTDLEFTPQLIFELMPQQISKLAKKELSLSDEQESKLCDILNENILVDVMIKGKTYRTAFKYYIEMFSCYVSMIGSVNDESVADFNIAMLKLISNSDLICVTGY